MPPPRAHRHRYYGVLAPNASLRAAVTALAPVAVIAPPPAPATDAAGTEKKPPVDASRYLWAMLLARIYAAKQVPWRDEALPLSCPICHAQMRIIAFINDASTVRKILDHLGESPQPPRIAPARGHRGGRRQQRLNRRATILSGIGQPSLDPRSSTISVSPGDEQLYPRPGAIVSSAQRVEDFQR